MPRIGEPFACEQMPECPNCTTPMAGSICPRCGKHDPNSPNVTRAIPPTDQGPGAVSEVELRAKELLNELAPDGTQMIAWSEEGPFGDGLDRGVRYLHSLCRVPDPFDWSKDDTSHKCLGDVIAKTPEEAAAFAKQIEALFASCRNLLALMADLRQQQEQLQKERAKLWHALRNHLCEHDLADWLACSTEHGTYCDVCNEHGHETLTKLEAAEASLTALRREQEQLQQEKETNAKSVEALVALTE